MQLKQNELLKLYWLNKLLEKGKIKIIRHKDNKLKDFEKIINNPKLLLEYQSIQNTDIYKDCKYIISYASYGKTYSVLKWLYRIKSKKIVENFKISEELIELGLRKIHKGYFYELEKNDLFSELENRLVIDWWKSTLSWHQWLTEKNNKDIIELRQKWFYKEFPWYLNIILNYYDLEKIINNKESNKSWYDKLSSIYAIYLILDTKTWNQYIWSAYWNKWLWWRWSEYIKTIHWWNKSLKEIINKNWYNYKYNFQYSILHVLSASKASDIIYYENLYKKKLWSKVFWLNNN